MAVRKFLDDTGAIQLNTILANKFNTKQDALTAGDYISIVNGVIDTIGYTSDVPIYILSSPRIWSTDVGIYPLSANSNIYYSGSSGSTHYRTLGNGILYIFPSSSATTKYWLWIGTASEKLKGVYGSTTSSSGTYRELNFTDSLIKDLYTGTAGNVNVWELEAGFYKFAKGTAYLFFDPSDNTKKVQLNACGVLVVTKTADNTVTKYTLYRGNVILEGEIDSDDYSATTYTATTCQSVQNKVNSLSSSSTNTEYPSAKCVYDNLALKANSTDVPQITYSTTDLTPGTSTLTTGTFYFVYE